MPFLFLVLFFSSFLHAFELTAESFIICKQKRATGIYIRTIKVFQLPSKKEKRKSFFTSNKTEYVTIYRIKNTDKLLAQNKRLSVAKKVAQQLQLKLEKNLWYCTPESHVKIFYPIES